MMARGRRLLRAQVAYLAFLAVLTACGAPSDTPTVQAEPSATASHVSGGSAPVGWVPPEQAPPPPDSDLRSALGTYAEYLLGDALVSPTSVEYGRYLTECYRSAGFDAELSADNEITASVPSDQRDTWYAVRDACMQAAIDDGLVMAPRSDDDYWGVVYDAYQITYACMQEKGLPVDPPPSRDSFIESGSLNWDPHARAQPGSEDSFEEACPKALAVLLPLLAEGAGP